MKDTNQTNQNEFLFEELNQTDLKDNNGGWLVPFIAGAIAGGIVYDVWKEMVKMHVDGTWQYHVPGYGHR
jgi:hypothetical protein